MAPLREIKKIIVHDAIIESITDYIRSSGLALGDRIPSERSLAETLKVSRSSVRGALKSLETEGVLEIRHGGGAYLRSLSSPIYYQYTSDHRENLHLLRDLVQARQAIEEWTVAEAAKVIPKDEVKRLATQQRRQLKALEAPDPAGDPEHRLPNMDLEIAITRVVGNAVLLDMHEKIEKMWKQAYKNLQMAAFPARMRYEHHMAIISALGARDEEAARLAISVHNRSLEKHIARAIEKLEQKTLPAAGG
ncbi:MAG: GntR family transcriptional regulator [Deltaproteobacteria bacterium]|nr:GntR family transcriptional regulator [Deltaproteobacteria bacterium]